MPRLTRRQALAATAALPVLPAMSRAQTEGGGGDPAPMRGEAHRSFDLGDRQVTTLLAGSRAGENPQETFGIGVDAETFQAVSEANFIPADRFQTFFTPVLVRDGERTVLFDTGFGDGALEAAMEGAGVAPGDVTHVVITHMHGDHIGGLLLDGAPRFENAEHVTGRVEHEHWTANPNEAVTANVLPIADRFTLVEDGAEIAPGITAMAAFGHSPGHMTYRVDGSGGSMLVAADLANHYVWSLAHPDWEVRFDMDKAQAAESRRRVLDMLATERLAMLGYHMPFPAAGFVERREDGFRWVPVSYQFTAA